MFAEDCLIANAKRAVSRVPLFVPLSRQPGGTLFRGTLLALSVSLALAGTSGVHAQEDVELLRQQLNEQRELIQKQRLMLEAQQKQLEAQEKALTRFGQRLDQAVSQQQATSTVESREPPTDKVELASSESSGFTRDNVGDLNRESIEAGHFPGSFKIPGRGGVSLALGGFGKTVALMDSHAEAMGADFIPATMGTRRRDDDGAFSIDSTITRIYLDGRAPVDKGEVGGYVEWDLNDGNQGSIGVKMRHAYGFWDNSHGRLVGGHTWSTLMDLKIIPEGLTEPTLSGVIFQRQPQVRWSQPLGKEYSMHLAIEDPSSSDVFDQNSDPELDNTKIPDLVVGGRIFPRRLRSPAAERDWTPDSGQSCEFEQRQGARLGGLAERPH